MGKLPREMKEGHFLRPHKLKGAERVILGLAEGVEVPRPAASMMPQAQPASVGFHLAAGTKHVGHFPVSKTQPKA